MTTEDIHVLLKQLIDAIITRPSDTEYGSSILKKLIAAGEPTVTVLCGEWEQWAGAGYMFRTYAGYVLGEIADPRAIPTLYKLLIDEPEVMDQALQSLKRIGLPAFRFLKEQLASQDEQTRQCAQSALAQWPAPMVV